MASLGSPVPDPQSARVPTVGPAPAGRDAMTELALEVVGVVDVSPSMRRLTLRSDALADFTYEPGQDLSFTIPVDDRMVRRRYTIRSMDDEHRTVDVDFVLHGHGPAARWATAACRTTPSPPSVRAASSGSGPESTGTSWSATTPPSPSRWCSSTRCPRPPRPWPCSRSRTRRTNRPRPDPSPGCTGAVRPWVIRHFSSTTCGRSSCPTATELSISMVSAV